MGSKHQERLALRQWAIEHALAPHIEAPENWPTRVRVGSYSIYPAHCGDHVPGFVGLYSIINGLALLLEETSPLKPAEERMLLDMGWKYLAGRGPVAPWLGIRSNVLERMAEGLTFALSRRRNDWIGCERLSLAGEAEKAAVTLERQLVAKQIVILLMGRSHYTVLRGYTPLSWLLFDATGRMWVKREREHLFAGQSWRQSAVANLF